MREQDAPRVEDDAMTFANLEQRMVNCYRDTFPPFVPADTGAEAESQEQFHRFMKRLYEVLFESPDLLIGQLHPDDAFSNRFNKSADKKPELREHMGRMLKQVEALLAALFEFGRVGRPQGSGLVLDAGVKIAKRHRTVLERTGMRLTPQADRGFSLEHPAYPRLFPAWIWMASRDGASVLGFSRCFFRPGHLYASDIYAKLLGDEKAFHRLEAHLRQRGFTAGACDEKGVTLDYRNLRGGKEKVKAGGYLYGVRHTGVSAGYDPLVKSPAVLGVCIPCMKELLTDFASLPEKVQAFMGRRTRRCGGCRYCVQTDKTGKRPLACIAVKHAGETLQLCPYFPGYEYSWTSLDGEGVDHLIAMLEQMDKVMAGTP